MHKPSNYIHWWLVIFCPKISGRLWGPTNDILSVCECDLSSWYTNSGGDIQTLPAISMKCLHSEAVVTLKHCSLAPLHPTNHIGKFSLLIVYYVYIQYSALDDNKIQNLVCRKGIDQRINI